MTSGPAPPEPAPPARQKRERRSGRLPLQRSRKSTPFYTQRCADEGGGHRPAKRLHIWQHSGESKTRIFLSHPTKTAIPLFTYICVCEHTHTPAYSASHQLLSTKSSSASVGDEEQWKKRKSGTVPGCRTEQHLCTSTQKRLARRCHSRSTFQGKFSRWKLLLSERHLLTALG